MLYHADIPLLPQSGPVCLASHPDNAQACSAPQRNAQRGLDPVDDATTERNGVHYIDPTSWFCSQTCTAVIANYAVYQDRFHVTATYARFLELVLGQALPLLPEGSSGRYPASGNGPEAITRAVASSKETAGLHNHPWPRSQPAAAS